MLLLWKVIIMSHLSFRQKSEVLFLIRFELECEKECKNWEYKASWKELEKNHRTIEII